MKEKIFLLMILLLGWILRDTNSWSLFLNLASVVALWYLVGEMFPKQRLFKILSAFFLAISPWHIKLVTQPVQINLAVLLSILGVLVLLKYVKRGKWLYISATILIFLISQIAYPLNLNLSNARDSVWLVDQQRREHGLDYNSFQAVILHNKAVNYSLSFIEHWGEYFSGDFLFIQGNLYLFDIVFLATGFLYILKMNQWKVWLLWMAIAPMAAAFDFAPPDYKKAALMVVPLVIISSWGAFDLYEKIHSFLKSYTIKK